MLNDIGNSERLARTCHTEKRLVARTRFQALYKACNGFWLIPRRLPVRFEFEVAHGHHLTGLRLDNKARPSSQLPKPSARRIVRFLLSSPPPRGSLQPQA